MDNSIVKLENKSLFSITGQDSGEFLQNIITNDFSKLSRRNLLYSSLLTPQGKFLYDFLIFCVPISDDIIVICEKKTQSQLLEKLNFYKLRSNVNFKITDWNIFYLFGEKNFNQKENNYLLYDEPRDNGFGKYVISEKEEELETFRYFEKHGYKKKNQNFYEDKVFEYGFTDRINDQLENKFFAAELNLLELDGVDLKKGCFIGQENTARINIRNKLKKRIFPIKLINGNIEVNESIIFKEKKIGEIISVNPHTFAVINLDSLVYDQIKLNNSTIQIVKPKWLNI